MESDKLKSISISKLKISDGEHEGQAERRVTFVASSTQEDRDGDIVQIDTFRLPRKGGGHIQVADLPTEGADNIDIPFLTNHDLWNVEKTIGSVRKAYYQDGKLIFECGISSREYAQDKLKLIEEGHLDNAFSIQYRDYYRNAEEGKDLGGEIVEVSLVTRGSNKEAQVLGVKALKGKQTMNPEDSNTPEQNPETNTDVNETTNIAQSQNEEKTEVSNTEETQEKQTNTEAEEKPEAEEKEKTIDMTTHKDIAAGQVKMPSQTAKVTTSAPADYLKSKQAEHDFARTIANNYNAPRAKVMQDWGNQLKEKGISGDAILPTRLEQVFFKAWEDHEEALGTFRHTRLLNGAAYAFNTTDRALGHKKGEKKADQNVTDVRRDYKAKIMYKRLPIDLQDLIDDQTGELLRFRASELSTRMGDELVRAVVFGDGRTAPTDGGPDYRIFDGTRGPWSMVNDLNEAAKTTGGNAYSSAVASVIANVTTDSTWQKIVKVKGAIRGGQGRKIIFVPEGTLTELATATKENGEPLFPLGTDMQNLFGVYIFESPYMEGCGYDVIGYREGSYILASGDAMVRSMFDMNYNTDVLMHERAVAGTLYGNKVAAGYASKA